MIEEFSKCIEQVKYDSIKIPIILNTSGKCLNKGESITSIKEELIEQCYKPVLWTRTMNTISEKCDSVVYEVGPGHTLAGFFKNSEFPIKVNRADDRKMIQKIVADAKLKG